MAEWLYEAGVGENRAALVEGDTILEARVERPSAGPRHGAIHRARFAEALVARRAARVELEGGGEAFLDPVPRGVGPGARLTVEIVREALPGRHPKLAKAKARADDPAPAPGPGLREQLDDAPVRELRTVDRDRLEAAGWSELVDEALTGLIHFPGGRLLIERTEAMTVIDVDGDLDASTLAIGGAAAAARAIRRLGIAGSIGIDLPTMPDRPSRARATEALDLWLPQPCERTAINGWGFVQIVRPRLRASLPELLAADPPRAAVLALYRRAEREPVPGPVTLTATAAVVAAATPADDAELGRRRGGAVKWRIDAALPIWGGHVQAGATR